MLSGALETHIDKFLHGGYDEFDEAVGQQGPLGDQGTKRFMTNNKYRSLHLHNFSFVSIETFALIKGLLL